MANSHSITLDGGAGQYLYTSGSPSSGLNLQAPFTIEMWVKVSDISVANRAIFAKKATSGEGSHSYTLQLNRNTGGKFSFLINSGDGLNGHETNIGDNNTAISANTWAHIALACDGASYYWYLYGVADGSPAFLNNPPIFSGVPVGIGHDFYTNFNGQIDDVRVWSVCRSATEIANNYQRELAGNETGLVSYWKLNNSYVDAGPGGNTLTPSGTPTFTTDVPFADSTTTSTSTSTTSTSSSTTTTSTSTSRTTSTSTTISITTSTSTTTTSTSSSTSQTTSTSTTRTETTTSTTTTSTSTTSTSSSTSTTTTTSTSTTTTVPYMFIVEKVK